MLRGQEWVKLGLTAHIDTSKQHKQLGLCVLWSQQRVEYIWMPHIMAHITIMCVVMAVKPHVTVDGRETPEQRQGPEPERYCNSPSITLHLCFALSVYVISLFFFLISSPYFPIPLRVSHHFSNISCFLLVLCQCLSHFSRLLFFNLRVTASERMSCTGQSNIVVILWKSQFHATL